MALQQSLAVFIMSKAKECAECGQGFAEDNSPVGGPISSTKCANGHVGLHEYLTKHKMKALIPPKIKEGKR